MSDELVEICAELIHESHLAWLVNNGDENVWIPKSQVSEMKEFEKDGKDCANLFIPEWLALQNGFI